MQSSWDTLQLSLLSAPFSTSLLSLFPTSLCINNLLWHSYSAGQFSLVSISVLPCSDLLCHCRPLTRLIGHCPLSFQLPSLLLPFSLNLVPHHHPPPVVWSHTLAVRDLLVTTVSEWGVFHLQSLYQSRTPAACIIRRMHESIGVSFVHIFTQRELFSRC